MKAQTSETFRFLSCAIVALVLAAVFVVGLHLAP